LASHNLIFKVGSHVPLAMSSLLFFSRGYLDNVQVFISKYLADTFSSSKHLKTPSKPLDDAYLVTEFLLVIASFDKEYNRPAFTNTGLLVSALSTAVRDIDLRKLTE
jgi:hypothetical protein